MLFFLAKAQLIKILLNDQVYDLNILASLSGNFSLGDIIASHNNIVMILNETTTNTTNNITNNTPNNITINTTNNNTPNQMHTHITNDMMNNNILNSWLYFFKWKKKERAMRLVYIKPIPINSVIVKSKRNFGSVM